MSRSLSRWESSRARYSRSLLRERAHGANRRARRIRFYSKRLSALMWNPKLGLILSRHEPFLSSVSYLGCLHCDLAGRFGCRSGQDGRYGRWISDRKASDIPWFLERLSNQELVFLMEASLGLQPRYRLGVWKLMDPVMKLWLQKPENFVTIKAWRGNNNGYQVWVFSSLDSAVVLWQSLWRETWQWSWYCHCHLLSLGPLLCSKVLQSSLQGQPTEVFQASCEYVWLLSVVLRWGCGLSLCHLVPIKPVPASFHTTGREIRAPSLILYSTPVHSK